MGQFSVQDIPSHRRAPYAGSWYALKGDAVIHQEGCRVMVSTMDCGTLNLESGQLMACDPFAAMVGLGKDPYIQTPKGIFPVIVTLANITDEEGDTDVREAYASIIFSSSAEVERQQLALLRDGEQPVPLDDGEMWTFPVDAGSACFADRATIARDMPNPDTWHDALFESDSPNAWFQRMDDPEHIREGIANIPLPNGDGQSNIIIVHSGWGDGLYPVLGGFDATGQLVAIHIDFMILGDPDEDGDGVEPPAPGASVGTAGGAPQQAPMSPAPSSAQPAKKSWWQFW